MATTLSATSSSATSLSSSSTAPLTVSRRVLRKTLNEALAIAGNAVQLDSAGDYARSVEAYQRSVELLDYGITLMKVQRDAGGERPGRDTSHEIAQLEQIREKYRSRIQAHRVERTRKAAALATKDSHHSSSASTSSSRRPRTPQSAGIPPPQPPPTAPLPPIPTVINSPPEETPVLQTTRPRGASLPSNQNQNQQQNHHHHTQQVHHHHESPKSPPDTATASEASTSADVNVRSPRTPPTPNHHPQTIQLNAIPLPLKKAKSSSRPQTAPGPAALSQSSSNISGPLRVRTTSGATAPKRSNSSTALLSKSTSQSSLNGRLNPPPPSNPPPPVRQAFLSPISPSKRADLIPLKKVQTRADVIPPFVTIFGLEPATKVTATAPPPKPTDPHRHPYHLLRLLLSTLNPIPSPSKANPNSNSHSVAAGGFITPKLYVPSSLWHQPDLWTLLLDLQEKVRLLETLKEALRTVHESSVILFGPMIFSSLRAPAKLKKSASTENTQFARSGMSQLDDPIEWLNALEKLAGTLSDLEKSASKKLGLRENGASVKKRMMDWSTRVAKKTMGGKGPSGELMDAYVDALTGVCNFGPMLDAHFCALRTVVPTARAGPLRRPTISRNPTSDGPIAKPLSPQTPGSANGAVPDFSTDPDVLPPAITQLVPKYSALPKFVNTQAVTHLEKATKIFSSFILPIILRDLAVLIEGLQEMRNGEWMGIQL